MAPGTGSTHIGAYLRSQILPVFGDLPLAAIDHLAIRTWVAELSSRRKPATVHKVAGILQKILRDAVDDGLRARNPAERVRLPRIERKEMRFLTPAKVAPQGPENLFDAADVARLFAALEALSRSAS